AIDSGFYLEKYFPLHHVRFIAVNDQYDSEDNSNSAAHMIVPLKNMVNEAYAADISRKVRSQQRQAMQEGQFVGSRPPYGYLKDPRDCHKLVVNPDTAPVVRQIFQWAADRVSKKQIVLNLNESGTLTPGRYLASIGLITNEKLMGSGVWQTRTLDVILNDEVYVGDMVQGKHTNVGHKQIPTKSEDWVIVRNTHEPIISRELFEKARAIRQKSSQNHTFFTRNTWPVNILKGKIFCGDCGKSLHREKNHGRFVYRCISNERIRRVACGAKIHITEDKLFRAIMTIIRQKAEVMLGKRLWTKQLNNKVVEKRNEVESEIIELQKQAQKSKAFLNGLYENLVNGILTETEYRELREGYTQEVNSTLERIQKLNAQQSELEKQAKGYTSMADMLAKIDTDTALTAQLVDTLIERITVNSAEDISIDFRFENGFDELMEVLSDE
uniref:recombinase family protein n=1 Tax=Acutalibacter intestini TaxID=3093659 RepID=UPI002AC8BE39